MREPIPQTAHDCAYEVIMRDGWPDWCLSHADAAERAFPLARHEAQRSGGTIRVWSCPECVAAEIAWLEEHPEPE